MVILILSPLRDSTGECLSSSESSNPQENCWTQPSNLERKHFFSPIRLLYILDLLFLLWNWHTKLVKEMRLWSQTVLLFIDENYLPKTIFQFLIIFKIKQIIKLTFVIDCLEATKSESLNPKDLNLFCKKYKYEQ